MWEQFGGVNMKTVIAAVALAMSTCLASSIVFAGPEAGHPNIIAARDDVHRAQDKIKAAQAANHDDMGGHAANALNLLKQVDEELRLAAEAANRH
jgi:hypothetical protein